MSLSRRDFVEASAGGLALLIGFNQLGCRLAKPGDAIPDFAPSQWLRIDRSGRVTIINDKSEMGQGAATALPMIVAEELGARWEDVVVEHARPGPQFPSMGTSGSDSVASAWRGARTAAAAAREMLVSAAAASWSVRPADCVVEQGKVRHQGSGREASFGDLIVGAAALPVPENPALKPEASYSLVGSRVPRLDAPAVVNGSKQFGLDVRRPGMLRAVLARAPSPGAKLRRWSGDRAKAIPGVTHVAEAAGGIAVVADSTWAAFRGRDALELEWDESASRGLDSAALWGRLERALGSGGKEARREGDPGATSAAAARRLEAEYRYPFQAHGAIEPLNAVALVEPAGCQVWAGTQSPNEAQSEVAQLLGLSVDQVVVNVLPLGGGFGRRISQDFVLEVVEVARLQGVAGTPVQLVWSREDDFSHDMFQPAVIVRMTAALDRAGAVTGWSHTVADFHLSMFGEFDPAFKPAEGMDPWGGFDTPYPFPALDVRIARQAAPVRTGAWRSVDYPASVLARECFVDEVADACGKDPVALRLELLSHPNPITRRGYTIDNRTRLKDVVSRVADEAGWSAPLPSYGPGRKIGRGIACNEYHRSTVVANVAEVSVGQPGDIIVHRVVVVMDCGRVVNLDGVEAQIEGGVIWALSTLFGREITFAGGRPQQRSYGDFPVLRIDRAPRIETHLVASSFPPFGVGEQPVPAVIPAVLNAVFRATGQRIRRLPLS